MIEDSKETARRLPGDLSQEEIVDRILRVDHAGEVGAKRIYEGQLAILKNSSSAELIQHMYRQELEHLKTFESLLPERRARPSLLFPLWHSAGFALGALTALLGEKAAMACTAAIEEVIDEHYQRQSEELGEEETTLKETIERFRADEIEHRNIALNHGAEQAPAYALLSRAIKTGSRMAIWLAERF